MSHSKTIVPYAPKTHTRAQSPEPKATLSAGHKSSISRDKQRSPRISTFAFIIVPKKKLRKCLSRRLGTPPVIEKVYLHCMCFFGILSVLRLVGQAKNRGCPTPLACHNGQIQRDIVSVPNLIVENIDPEHDQWAYRIKHRMVLGMVAILCAIMISLGLMLLFFTLKESERGTQELTSAMAAGIRQAMLNREPEVIQKSIFSIAQSSDSIERVFLMDSTGTVAYSSEPEQIGHRFDASKDLPCIDCHQVKGEAPSQHSIITTANGRRIQRNVRVIPNEPVCHGCHNPKEAATGKLVVDRPFSRVVIAVAKVEIAVALLGLLCLAILGPLLSRNLNSYTAKIMEQQQELTSLYVLLDRLSKTIDTNELKSITVEVLNGAMEADETILLTGSNQKVLHCIAWSAQDSGVRRKKIAPSDPDYKSIEQWLQVPYSQNRLSDSLLTLFVPIPINDHTRALVVIRRNDRPFPTEKLRFVEMMASHVTIAFENAKLYTMAITDDLSQLYARRYFDFCLGKEIKGVNAPLQQLTLLMLDLDDFKAVNDNHGHSAGDEVLRVVAKCIQSNLRSTDLAFRYGGEEMAALLPNTSLEEGAYIAERIRKTIEETRMPFEGNILKVTASIGAASYPVHGSSPEAIIQEADKALYLAKKLGKNGLVLSGGSAFFRPEDAPAS
jgi:diguanylate cyclase (GGDEF)-like protein